LEKKASSSINKLKRITSITTEEEYNQARDQTKILKDVLSEATKQKKEMTDGIQKTLKAIQAHFKPFENKVAVIESEIKTLMAKFLDKKEEKKIQLEEKFSKGKMKVSTFADKSSALSSSAGVRKVEKLFINDVSKIPREYLVPDEDKIKQALKEGTKIAGCELKRVNSISI
jgi:glycerate kinase